MVFSKIKTVYKIACLLISAVASGTLMWTNSRSGWVSLGMAVLFMGFLIVSKIREKKAFINIFLTAILILILIFPLYPRLYNKIYGRFAGHDGGSAESRLPQFEIAYNIIKSNPILGIGINRTTDSGMFFRVSGEYTDYDDISLTSQTADAVSGTKNKIDASLDTTAFKLAIGKAF